MDAPERSTPETSSAACSPSSRQRSTRPPPVGSPVPIPEFTEEEYLLYLEHPQWTREDTLSLLDAVRIFDYEWNLVASTFNGDTKKTPSACQKRYRQLEEFVAAKKRQKKEMPGHSKQQQQKKSRPSPPSVVPIKPSQTGKSQRQQPANAPSGTPLSAINPLAQPLGIPAPNTTVFPIGAGGPFAFDASALMRQQMAPIFALFPTASPLHPSLATMSIPQLPSALPPLTPAALQAIAMSSVPPAQPVVGAPGSKQAIPTLQPSKPKANARSGEVAAANGEASSKNSTKRPMSFSPMALAPSPSSSSSNSAPSSEKTSEEYRKKKRRRRTASEIARNYKCDIASCTKAYGSEGALKMHIRMHGYEQKHPGLRATMKQPYVRSNSLILSPWLGMPSVVIGQGATFPPAPSKSAPTPIKPSFPATATGANLAPKPAHLFQLDQLGRVQTYQSMEDGHHNAQVKKEPMDDVLLVPFVRLEIGGYECASKMPGDLMAKFNFVERSMEWEVVAAGVKLTISVQFDDIAGFGLEMIDGFAVLTIEYKRPPKVNWAGNLPMTNRIARFKRHALHFTRESLNKPVEMMLSLDARLRELANLGLPSLDDPFFEDDAIDDADGPSRCHSVGSPSQTEREAGSARLK